MPMLLGSVLVAVGAMVLLVLGHRDYAALFVVAVLVLLFGGMIPEKKNDDDTKESGTTTDGA